MKASELVNEEPADSSSTAYWKSACIHRLKWIFLQKCWIFLKLYSVLCLIL